MASAAKRKLDPYEELGVDRSADDKAIKQAFRAKARKAHPDTGGSPEAFDRLKRAELVLSDPAKRAKYDATGEAEETAPNIIDQGAWGLIGDLIFQAIEKEANVTQADLFGVIRAVLERDLDSITGDMAKAKAKVAKAEKLIGRFKRKQAGVNVMERMLLHHIDTLKKPLALMIEAQAIRRRGLELLKEYDFTRDVPREVQAFMWSGMASSTSTTTG